MKKVIFLCLLSFSVCLSKPAEDQAAPAQAVTNGAPETKPLTTPEQVSPLANTTSPVNKKDLTPAVSKGTETATSPQNATEVVPHPGLPSNEEASSPASNPKASSMKPAAETSKPAEDNNTTHKEVPQKPKEEDATKTSAETKASNTTSSDVKPNEGMAKNGTFPDSKDVTPKPEFPKTTEAPKSDKPKNIVQARGFDGPSFIGGIILTLGILAIGFMGFKYYKNQTERNYHTL